MKHLLLFVIVTCSFSFSQQSQKFINVTGNAELIRKADQMKFVVYIKTIEESVESSKKLNDKYLVDLLIILKEAGIPSEDTEISPLAFGKNIDRDGNLKGYYTQTTITFILKDLEKYYYLTNRLSSNNAFEISSEYSLSNYEEVHREAYQMALTAAKEKAEYMAQTLNLTTGEVLEIEELKENYFGATLNLNTAVQERGSDVNGNVALRRSVRVKFGIR